MSRYSTDRFEFRPEDGDTVVAAMEELGSHHGGWINFRPGVRAEDVPPAPERAGGFVLDLAA